MINHKGSNCKVRNDKSQMMHNNSQSHFWGVVPLLHARSDDRSRTHAGLASRPGACTQKACMLANICFSNRSQAETPGVSRISVGPKDRNQAEEPVAGWLPL